MFYKKCVLIFFSTALKPSKLLRFRDIAKISDMREIQARVPHILSTAIARCGVNKYGFMNKNVYQPLGVGQVKHLLRNYI